MDHSAISLARENAIPIIVFSIHAPGAFASVVAGAGTFYDHHTRTRDPPRVPMRTGSEPWPSPT